VIDEPRIVRTERREAAVIRFTIPRSEIKTVMQPGIAELMNTIAEQGIDPIGPVFSRHFRLDPEVFDFEVGVSVATPVIEAGRVKPGELPAAMVARTIYRGDYEGLGKAWGEFNAWLSGEGHKPATGLWECYVKGPESGPDAATWETELNRPLERQAD